MVVSKYDIPWHRMPSLVSRNIGRNGGGPGFVFCFNCIFPRFLITVLCPLILMSSQQGAQTWITAEGENSQTSFAKKYNFKGKCKILMLLPITALNNARKFIIFGCCELSDISQQTNQPFQHTASPPERVKG